ncbi:MAG: choice-of-anchor D domain-containing protein, partial [Bacteroidetes bacterium]|nr:choice-of-anchor D domain-containing protein [Bacteroidota bacterium]
MKKFLPFLASLLLASVSWGQTGNGVVLLTDASYTFTPTTVDSSATFNLSLKNAVGIAQTVFFGGLDGPFELSSSDPIEVPSQDTVDFSITFTPSAIGSFTDTLEVIGNVFGSASLIVSGDGIQVQLTWTPDTLAFDTTAIGQTNSQILVLSSIGDGAAVISDIVISNEIFTVDSALSSFTIAEGASDTIVVNYAP